MRKILAVVLLVAITVPAGAVELWVGAGGLSRDREDQVVQVGASVDRFPWAQVAVSHWREQDAVSGLYAKRWKYLEAAAGLGYATGDEWSKFHDEHAVVHARAVFVAPGVPFFVSYEVMRSRDGGVGFLMGGVRWTWK